MTFVIKQKYVEPHRCVIPQQIGGERFISGDMWRCDDCRQCYVWALYYGRSTWFPVSDREANKRLKRHRQCKPPKRRHAGMGPG